LGLRFKPNAKKAAMTINKIKGKMYLSIRIF
jgi:hypothetical protein